MTARFFLRSLTTGALAAIAIASAPATSAACPKAGKLLDFNCDRTQRIAVTGDSIVRGVGDTLSKGGYVSRLGERLPQATVLNVGIPGITSKQLLRGYKMNLRRGRTGTTFQKSRDTDIFIIAVGVNDYWGQVPPAATVTNIRRLVKFLRSRVRDLSGVAPYVAVATLTPNTREQQRPFVTEVNRLLLKLDSPDFPVKVRFDTLPDSILSDDRLHPTSFGYDTMTTVAEDFVKRVAQREELKLRPDADGDGVFDLFELSRYSTDPTKVDTDEDGLTERQELFRYGTDPLNPDSDGDGEPDRTEILARRDPLIAGR